MDGWTRLPGGGWMRELENGAALVAEPVAGGFQAQAWSRGRLVMESGPWDHAAFAAGVARGWWLARQGSPAGRSEP